MATKYVDIGVDSGAGAKDGSSEANYMGWNDYATLVDGGTSDDYYTVNNIVSGDTVLIRGTRTITTTKVTVTFNINWDSLDPDYDIVPHEIKKWGDNPWRLLVDAPSKSTVSLNLMDVYISDGIISVQSSTENNYINVAVNLNAEIRITNCMIYGMSSVWTNGISYETFIKGSYLSCKGFDVIRPTSECTSTNIIDTAMIVPVGTSLPATYNYVFTNIVTDRTKVWFDESGTGSHADTNCQYEWTPPTLPAWDAAKELFAYATLVAGVLTPPQPGNSPYTGYTTFLWGTRSGVGTGYVESTPPPTPSTYFGYKDVISPTGGQNFVRYGLVRMSPIFSCATSKRCIGCPNTHAYWGDRGLLIKFMET